MNSLKLENHELCQNCGRCCYLLCDKEVFTIKDEDLDDTIKYYQGLKIKLFRWKGNKYYGMMHRKCKHLDMKTKKCVIYDDRPKPCRDYPSKYYIHIAEKWCPLMMKMRQEGKL
jgi:Fe-S-cluster containining protein